MSIAKTYNPKEAEEKWYSYWKANGFFRSTPDEREPYTIVMPPPNVTGVLHMGHMLNNTIQDVLIRRARMQGKNACWVPGTDHASIATEAKVVAMLKEQGIDKRSLSREDFLKHAWEWKEKYGGIILKQLEKLGASCDWDRTRFTMDPELYQSVIRVFVDLYRKGLIYRGYRMVNWDPEAKTNISDEEVIYKEKNGKLYHLKYQVEGTDQYIVVATTRPETIFGDTAVCINPNDERYTWLKGKQVIVPIVGRKVNIIEDEYVDLEFGTGCLKVTPAHDVNDYALGKKHNLEFVDIFTDEAKLNDNGLHYAGMDRFKVRKEIEKELEEKGLLEQVENYTNNVGTSERTGAVIEPKISNQWFLKMEDLAKPALDNVMDDTIKFHPTKFKNIYRNWMENVTDWNISRQLWWGHQIPAYFYGDGNEDFVVAQTVEEALVLAQEKSGNTTLQLTDLRQDEDVLDTWFSAWLWPISVFNGINEPENAEINYYYPTQDLVTAPDIIFFWVARMIVSGYEFRGQLPFENVYFTGIVRDKLGRKMSKSLGNSPDPIDLMNEYGADATRMGMLLTAPAGNDLPFDVELCVQGRNFANKIWNAFRLVKGWEITTTPASDSDKISAAWFEARLNQALVDIEENFKHYRLSDALMTTYKLVWDDFCAWYLELVKPAYGSPISSETLATVQSFFQRILTLVHPFMPFLTEELWHDELFGVKDEKDCIIVAPYPTANDFDEQLIKDFAIAQQIISEVRNIRNSKGISPKVALPLAINQQSDINLEQYIDIITKIANLEGVTFVSEKVAGAASFLAGKDECYVTLENNIDADAERERIEKELEYLKGFLVSVDKKLSNERFVQNAKPEIVENEKSKKADAEVKIKILQESLTALG